MKSQVAAPKKKSMAMVSQSLLGGFDMGRRLQDFLPVDNFVLVLQYTHGLK
jgi:hypothetical protein